MKAVVPSRYRVILTVGWVTFLELIRDKVLYNILLCAFFLLLLSLLASNLIVVQPERIILDFGFLAVNISCAMIAIFTGSSLLGKEFERRTLYVALSRPITRMQFILGKFAGLMLLIGLNWILLGLTYFVLLYFSFENLRDWLNSTLLLGMILLYVATWVIASLALLFSTFSTPALSAILSIGFYLIGNTVSHLWWAAEQTRNPFHQFVLKALAIVLPNIECFNLGSKITYGLPVGAPFFGSSVLYGASVTAFFLFIAGQLIRSREI